MVRIYKANDVETYVEQPKDNKIVNVIESDSKPNNESAIKEAEILAENILSKAKSDAQIIISKAKNEADEILEIARKEAERLFEEANDNGRKQALSDCENEVKDKLISAELKSNEIISNAYTERDKILNDMQDEILSLSINIAKKILQVELNRNDEAYKSIILNAISKISENGNVKVRISEGDYEKYFSNDNGEDFLKRSNHEGTLISDKMLNKGDCIIDSDNGTIDASIDKQLKQIKIAFGVNA